LSIKKFLYRSPSVNLPTFLFRKERARFRDLNSAVYSRGGLSYALKYLLEEKLITREVDVNEVPVKVYYKITKKGRKVARYLIEMRGTLSK